MKLAVKYTPGCAGEYIATLISGVKNNTSPPVDEDNRFNGGHPRVDNNDYHFAIDNNRFDLLPRWEPIKDVLLLHFWTLNVIARAYKDGVRKVLVISDDTLQAEKLFWYKVHRHRNHHLSYTLEHLRRHKIDFLNRVSEKDYVTAYGKKCFDVKFVTFDELFNQGNHINIIEEFAEIKISDEWKVHFDSYCIRNREIVGEVEQWNG